MIGADNGLWILDRRTKDASKQVKKVIELKTVTQVDVLEQHGILLALADKNLYSYSMESLENDDNLMGPTKRGRKISGANFFKIGVFDGQHLVCCVKTSTLSATIKVYKPMDSMTATKKKSSFAKMLAGGQEVLKPYKVRHSLLVLLLALQVLLTPTQGILHSHRDLLDTLPSVISLRRLCAWF